MMKMDFLLKSFAALTAAALVLPSIFGQSEKNVAQVEFRTLPPDYEQLPFRESEKWNFGFRPYGAEAASVLWSDPNVIRNAAAGDSLDEKHLVTGLYVACDEYGFNILGYGALKKSDDAIKAGRNLENVFFECFFIPGDADTQKIINYQPFGAYSIFPYWQYKLSWMKNDRNNRVIFNDMVLDARYNQNGAVTRFYVPWLLYWDHLPVFYDKQDNFWRLSMIRWGGSFGGETWGGNVHSQTKCGYIRMPDFTKEQTSLILKTTLNMLWSKYVSVKTDTAINPDTTGSVLNAYRKSIDHLPHSWMNMNEDVPFKTTTLKDMIKSRDAIGAGIVNFDKMTLEEQKAFYKKNAPLLANFQYDVEAAYAEYLKQQLMKR